MDSKSIQNMERTLLEKVKSGALDDLVGDDFAVGNHAKVIIRKVIKDGIPQILRIGPDSKYFDGKETIQNAGKASVQYFRSDSEILAFLQKYGWLMKDSLVRAYSALFKPQK